MQFFAHTERKSEQISSSSTVHISPAYWCLYIVLPATDFTLNQPHNIQAIRTQPASARKCWVKQNCQQTEGSLRECALNVQSFSVLATHTMLELECCWIKSLTLTYTSSAESPVTTATYTYQQCNYHPSVQLIEQETPCSIKPIILSDKLSDCVCTCQVQFELFFQLESLLVLFLSFIGIGAYPWPKTGHIHIYIQHYNCRHILRLSQHPLPTILFYYTHHILGR